MPAFHIHNKAIINWIRILSHDPNHASIWGNWNTASLVLATVNLHITLEVPSNNPNNHINVRKRQDRRETQGQRMDRRTDTRQKLYTFCYGCGQHNDWTTNVGATWWDSTIEALVCHSATCKANASTIEPRLLLHIHKTVLNKCNVTTLTWLPMPSKKSMKKNNADQTGDSGIKLSARGYATNANPGPGNHHPFAMIYVT